MTSPGGPDVVRTIAGYGLPGSKRALPGEILDDLAWDAVARAAFRERITGHLMRALHDGELPATDAQRLEASELHERALVRDVVLERFLLSTLAAIDGASSATRVLRGPSVAHTVYASPELRSFGDVDLLVRRPDYDRVVSALCRQGGRRRFLEPRSGFDARFGKGVCITMPDGLEIDVHRTFVAGPFGLAVDTAALFDTDATFALGGETLSTLDPETRFLDGCFHAALGRAEPRMVPLRDVAQMALCAPLDVPQIRELCRSWRCGIVVQRALGLAWKAFELDTFPELVAWVRSHEASTFERSALHSYVSVNRSYSRQAVAGLRAVQGARAKAAYVSMLLVPNRAYMRMHEGGYLRRARRGIRLFVNEWFRRTRRAPTT